MNGRFSIFADGLTTLPIRLHYPNFLGFLYIINQYDFPVRYSLMINRLMVLAWNACANCLFPPSQHNPISNLTFKHF